MRTWLWVLSATWLPSIYADVLCDVRMSERTVMLINTKTGDEKYTAATLELECNDVYKKDGETVRSPWPLWLKKCTQWGTFYDPASESCGICPDASGQSPQEAFPDLNLPDDSWFRQCVPTPSATGLVCSCSYEYSGYDDSGNYNSGTATQTAPITERCKAADDGCMEFISSQYAWSQQPWMLKLPSYTCTGLPPFAPSGDVSSSMMTPPLEKDSLYQLLRNSFADGVDTNTNIMKDWKLLENSVKILFMSRISKSGQDLSVGPSLAELASNCQININVYFDTQGTAVNNGESVPASAIPTYSPQCVADEVNHMKEFIANITGEMAHLANNNVTCNASKDNGGHHGYRRLSKRDTEVEKLLQSWEEMARVQGRPAPTILGQMQLKKEAQRLVAARQAKEWKRKLQDETEHYVVKVRVRFFMEDTCESMGASVGTLPLETVAGFYLPLLERVLGADSASQHADKWKVEPSAPYCAAYESADGTAMGSSSWMQFIGDAGPVKGGDDSLQTAWYNAILSAASDSSLYTSAVTDPIVAALKDATGVTITGFIIPDVTSESSPFYGGEAPVSVEATTMSFQPGACEPLCFEKMCEAMSCEEKYKCMDCASDAMCSSPSTEGCGGYGSTETGGTGSTGSTGSGEASYMVKGTLIFWTSDSCETLGQSLAQLSPEVIGGIFLPVMISAMGEDWIAQYADRLSVPMPECKPTELPDGTTAGSSIYVPYGLDAKSDQQLQQEWYATMKAASEAYDKYTDIANAVKKLFLELASYEPTDFTLYHAEDSDTPLTWGVELADGSPGSYGGTGSNSGTGGYGGTTGTGGYGDKGDNGDNGDYGGQQEAWWELKEGMRCEQKRQIIEERSQRLLQHAFVITGKDSWAGCKGFLDSWVVYGTQTKTKTTNKCTVPYEDNTGAVNPAWEKDPCCNWVKRQEQCCGPRLVEEKITVVDDVNESNIALFSAATDSGTLALDLAMTYASSETEAAKSCFGPFKDFMDATSDVWKVVDDCRIAVEGAWSETFQVQLGAKCTSNIDCYTGECYVPVSSNKGGGSSGGSSGGQKQKYCKTPDAMVVPNWGTATLTCLIDKSIPELKGRLAIRLKLPGSSTPAELARKFLAEPGMQRSECRGHDNPWSRHTEEECMAPKQCNYDGAITNETECLNPCEDGDVSCSSYCGEGEWEVSELPFCMPRVQDGGDPWSACHTYVWQKRQEWELECQQCDEQCNNIDWSDPKAEPCNCHEPDGPCDFWRREQEAEKECMNDYCGRYCSGGECASLYRWQCIYAGFSFVNSRKEECLSECSAAGGPNPVPQKNCRAVLNPSTATEDACFKLGQGWIELHYTDIPNWDWSRGNPPPESCVIKSYEVLNGKPYVPPPPYGPTCLPECESELDSCIDNPECHSLLEAEGKQVFQICEERFELFRESYESCLEQQRNLCSGVGCMRMYRACRISTGLEVDPIFKEVGCAGCDGWWSNRASRELQCAEELSVEQCRWNVTTQSTESQACARECMWEICDQAFAECQIAGGTLAECNNQTISMNQCRECNFIHCEDRCNQGACDVIFGSRDEAYRSCAGCDTSAQCNPSSPCYGDSADSSCNYRWGPEFGHSCSILCEESLRMCQEGVRGFCWNADDTGVSRSDACHMEYDMYRADMDACWQANFPATLPEGAIWREIEIETTMTCAAKHLPQDWDCLKCDGEWNSWVVWSADLGPKCIAGSVSFDNGKTVPDTCSNCKPRTCPQYPVNCEARWYDERQCHWNEYNFKMCSKSDAEAKAVVVAANAECAECQTARCEWSCYESTCAELMMHQPWDRMAPVEQCSGCPDVARCHPGAECFISDVVAFTQADLDDWTQFLTLFQPMMDQYVQCTGMPLQRRLKVAEATPKTPKVQPPTKSQKSATKAQRTSQVLKDLENEVTALWRQGNRLRNEGRNKRYQLKQLATQKVGRTNFQGVLARRDLVEKQHQELQKRYLTLVQSHGKALEKWLKEGGVASAPPHHPMSAFDQELRTVGSSSSRRLKDEMPQQVQLACTGTNCATESDLCSAFFNRGGVAQQLVDTLVSSFSFDVLPWDSQDEICQHMGEICYMSLAEAETTLLQGVYDDTFRPPWVEQWCDGMENEFMANCDASTMCTSCSDLTTPLDYATCDGCCRCFGDATGYYSHLKHGWGFSQQKCHLVGIYLRNSGMDTWVSYDERLLGGEGACSLHLNVWDVFKIPDACHDAECYQNEACAAQCRPPELTEAMCPRPFPWSFFKSTREWRPGMLATKSACEEESCYPQPWIPTEEECKTVSHCESHCPYCETDQFWDWEAKKQMVKCSFVSSKTSKPLSEADCKIACGGSFTGNCYFKKDNRSTAAACITDPPTDALGSTTYEKCVGQKALTGASVSSANYELLQCSAFTTEQCGWAKETFGSDMACTIHQLQCKNKADCKGAGRCDYEWDDWQIQENGGLCVAPTDFSKDTSYNPHRDFWSECYNLGGEHRSYGCLLYEKKTKDTCTEVGAKWFPSAHSMSKCEVPGYAWKKMSTGGFYSGTMACCVQLRGSKSEGRCEMFTQDENSTSCEHCGGTWMSIFKFRSHGRWMEGSWQKSYKWTARAFEPSNKWVTRIAFEKVTDVWQNLIAAIRAVPAVNFVTCRINPTLDTLVAIAKQTAAQSTLGTVPLLPATASAMRMGDYVVEPFDNSVTGTTEIDVQVNLLSSGAVVAENAAGDNTTSTAEGNRRQRRLAGTGLSDTLTASCYTVVQNAGRYIGQLVGDCIIFNTSTPLDNPVQVCLPTNPQIPVYGAFNLDCLVTVNSGVYTVAPMTVTKSSDGLSTCASLSASGTYCPGKIFGTGEPDRSAPSGCGSVTAISDTVTTQAAVLKAAGPVSLPGLVKIGETVSSDGFAPQAVYISSSGTVKSVEDGLC